MSTTWSEHGVRWFAYAEPHRLADPDRRRAGVAARLEREPDAVLRSPAEVVAWIRGRQAVLGGRADADGRRLQGLMADLTSVTAGVAARGRSAYASVRLSLADVVDLCVEAVPPSTPAMSDDCVSPRGHSYQMNRRGEWRCLNCGQLL